MERRGPRPAAGSRWRAGPCRVPYGWVQGDIANVRQVTNSNQAGKNSSAKSLHEFRQNIDLRVKERGFRSPARIHSFNSIQLLCTNDIFLRFASQCSSLSPVRPRSRVKIRPATRTQVDPPDLIKFARPPSGDSMMRPSASELTPRREREPRSGSDQVEALAPIKLKLWLRSS